MVFWYLKPRYSGTCTLEDVLFLRIPWLNYAADTSTLSSKSSGFHPSFLGVCNGFVRCLGRFWGSHRAIVFFQGTALPLQGVCSGHQGSGFQGLHLWPAASRQGSGLRVWGVIGCGDTRPEESPSTSNPKA